MVDLAALAAVSASFGADLNLVQGQGGNSSLKDGRVMWIKASGLCLADALARPVFVPVDLDRCEQAFGAGDEVMIKRAVRTDLLDVSLLPSIETTMHALMPHRVVFHGHPVNTLSWATAATLDHAALWERLAGLSWTSVPYRRPGLPLTRAIVGVAAADVYILANHGLTVGADTPDAAYALYRDVERRLARTKFKSADPITVADPDAPSGFERLHSPAIDRLIADGPRIAALRNLSLYPDHVVFLGPGLPVAARVADVAGAARFNWCMVPGIGVFVAKTRSPTVDAMIEALARVLARVPASQTFHSLSELECVELLDWDIEKYRQALTK